MKQKKSDLLGLETSTNDVRDVNKIKKDAKKREIEKQRSESIPISTPEPVAPQQPQEQSSQPQQSIANTT